MLDSSVAIQHLRGRRDIAFLAARFQAVYLPLIALGELHVGIRRSERSTENLAALRHFTASVTLLSLTEQTSIQYAEIKHQLRLAGTPIPENDIWIAAHARELDAELACLDVHFRQIQGLRIFSW